MGKEKNIDSLHVMDLSIYLYLASTRTERKKNFDRVKYICTAIDLRMSLTSMRREGWMYNGEKAEEKFDQYFSYTERKMCSRKRKKIERLKCLCS